MSEYILDLRKTVGHRPLLQVGAGVIVEDSAGRILLQRRADNHLWGYAGGSLELDEEAEEAARRELLEETGRTAGEMTLFGVFSGKDTHYVYPNGDEVSNVDIVYVCREYSGELCCQAGEVEELRFFSPDQIPPELSPPIESLSECISNPEPNKKSRQAFARLSADFYESHGCRRRYCSRICSAVQRLVCSV